MEKQEKKQDKKERNIVGARGRKFQGAVTKKFEGRITIEFEKVNFDRKYERYIKSKTKIHARLPKELESEVNVGDYVEIRECRPLSKILHHIVTKKIKGAEEK